jgi:cytochrome c peroxidase
MPFIVLAGVFIFGLSFPISNFFIVRVKLPDQSGNAAFAPVSKILQSSCVDCHSAPDLVAYPFYAKFPIAKDTIARDMLEGQKEFVLTKAQISGTELISNIDLAKISTVVEEGSMPPIRYKALHWDASLNREQRQAILNYIQSRNQQN